MWGQGALGVSLFFSCVVQFTILTAPRQAWAETLTLLVLPVHADGAGAFVSETVQREAYELIFSEVSARQNYTPKAGHDFRRFHQDFFDVDLNSETCARLASAVAKHYQADRVLCPIVTSMTIDGSRQFGSIHDVMEGELRIRMDFRIIDPYRKEVFNTCDAQGRVPIRDQVVSAVSGESLLHDGENFQDLLRKALGRAIKGISWSLCL